MPITLLTRPFSPPSHHFLHLTYNVDYFNTIKDPYRVSSSQEEVSFQYPYTELPLSSRFTAFVEALKVAYTKGLVVGTPIKIESVKAWHLHQKEAGAYLDHNMIELGTTQDATRESYREAADYFQNLFHALKGHDAAREDGFVVEVYHLENITMKDDTVSLPLNHMFPAERWMAAMHAFVVARNAIKDLIGGLLSLNNPTPCGWESGATFRARVVHGSFKGEDFRRLTLFVVVCPRTMTMWHSLEEVVKTRAEEKLRGDRDLVVWFEFVTGIRAEDEPPAVGSEHEDPN